MKKIQKIKYVHLMLMTFEELVNNAVAVNRLRDVKCNLVGGQLSLLTLITNCKTAVLYIGVFCLPAFILSSD